MKTLTPHAIGILKLPRKVADAITFSKNVLASMTNNANFPAPSPALSALSADIAALDAAEALVLQRTKGAAESRNAKLAVVEADLKHELSYVQQCANASPATAEAIIQSAGMTVRKTAVRTKSEIAVKLGKVSGAAAIVAKAVAHRASYEWQYSTDQKTWTVLPVTLEAKTTVTGLTPATVYFFRFRGVTKAGEGNWSQIVSILMV